MSLTQKYKACCNKRCLLASCEIRNNGGCICVCSLQDKINLLKSIIDGYTIFYRSVLIYIPDEDNRKSYISRMSELDRNNYMDYKEIKASENLKFLEKILKGKKKESNGEEEFKTDL